VPTPSSVSTLRRPFHDWDDDRDPFIDFPIQTKVSDDESELPEGDSLISFTYDAEVTAFETIRPPYPEFNAVTSSVPWVRRPVVMVSAELPYRADVQPASFPPGESGVIGRRLLEARKVLDATASGLTSCLREQRNGGGEGMQEVLPGHRAELSVAEEPR